MKPTAVLRSMRQVIQLFGLQTTSRAKLSGQESAERPYQRRSRWRVMGRGKTSYPTRSPLAVVLAALAIGCGSDAPTEESELSEEKQAMLERWQQSEFIYDDSADYPFQCQVLRPHTPALFQFECDIVIIGLVEGVTSADVADLLAEISGTIVRDRSHLALPSIDVKIPPRTEKSAILAAVRDDCTRYATVSILGPGEP